MNQFLLQYLFKLLCLIAFVVLAWYYADLHRYQFHAEHDYVLDTRTGHVSEVKDRLIK